MKLKAWFSALRLRTLPLAVSCVITGAGIAWQQDMLNWEITSLALCTTIFLQILSNLANDFGDGVKGTDNDARIGPARAIQSGAISQSEMKLGIYVSALISFTSGLWLLLASLQFNWTFFIMLCIGLLSIGAAVKYTIGKSAFGYKGLGDLFVFLFFGPVGVLGTSFLQIGSFDWMHLLPAASIGLLCTSVLNLNNMRDHKNDKNSNKNTMVVYMGYRNAKHYHAALTILPMLLFGTYVQITANSLSWTYFSIPFFVVLLVLIRIYRIQNEKLMDGYLKILALTTFFTSVIFILSLVFTF